MHTWQLKEILLCRWLHDFPCFLLLCTMVLLSRSSIIFMLKQKIYSEVVMSKETITLEVSKETAKMVAALTSYQREKIDTLFDIWLRGRSYDNNDNSVAELLSLMDETAKYAEKKGLTPEKMEGLFDKTPNGFQ